MNPKIALIIGVFAILMVLGGKNPIEEERQAREEKYKGIDDPLMRAIKDYHDENKFSESGNGLDDKGRRSKTLPRHMYPQNHRPNSYNDSQSYMRSQTLDKRRYKMPAPGRNNGLYPPPPQPKNGGPRSEYQNNPMERPRYDSHMYLASGQRVIYHGTKVFVMDDKGEVRPLADGKYRMRTGVEIRVIGGRKILASN